MSNIKFKNGFISNFITNSNNNYAVRIPTLPMAIQFNEELSKVVNTGMTEEMIKEKFHKYGIRTSFYWTSRNKLGCASNTHYVGCGLIVKDIYFFSELDCGEILPENIGNIQDMLGT